MRLRFPSRHRIIGGQLDAGYRPEPEPANPYEQRLGGRETAMKRKRAKKKGASRFTPLEHHKRHGKRFVPPMMSLPNLKLTSWINDRLPEHLWLALLISERGRLNALDIVRSALASIRDDAVALGQDLDLTHSGIANWGKQLCDRFLGQLGPCVHALRPLGLLEYLPARDRWTDVLPESDPSEDWSRLVRAVLPLLDHQSQESTDCRWARVVFKAITGRMQFHTSQQEMALELLEYPNRGDQRAVRPMIRASEQGLDLAQQETPAWPPAFWAQCFQQSPCFIPDAPATRSPSMANYPIAELRATLLQHWSATHSTTAVDPRHDAVFGMALYSARVLEELATPSCASSVHSRIVIRTLLELAINLTYLLKIDTPEAWQEFRSHGSGQAKLAVLHMDRLGAPTFVKLEDLERLANEDMWLEHVTVDVGHWASRSVRDLASEAGLKDLYDRFYPWASSYAHGEWSSIRGATMTTCLNPLHRLHRVPLIDPAPEPSAIDDAAELVDTILAALDRAYPQFSYRLQREPAA